MLESVWSLSRGLSWYSMDLVYNKMCESFFLLLHWFLDYIEPESIKLGNWVRIWLELYRDRHYSPTLVYIEGWKSSSLFGSRWFTNSWWSYFHTGDKFWFWNLVSIENLGYGSKNIVYGEESSSFLPCTAEWIWKIKRQWKCLMNGFFICCFFFKIFL